ncbi:hypothetical protein Gotur_019995, partial [Gossypium turneri]
MEMTTMIIVVMGNHELGKKTQEKKGQVEMLSLRRSTHVEKCPKKSALKENPMGTTLLLGSSTRGVETKKAESDKKSVEYFLCHGLHRLRKFSRKSDIEGNDGADKEPKKLGSSKGKAKAKRAKMSKKKRGLPPKEEASLSSDLEGKVMMKTMELRPMRLKLSEASELIESSTRLPPMGEVGGASNFKEKEVMHMGQLTRVNVTIMT